MPRKRSNPSKDEVKDIPVNAEGVKPEKPATGRPSSYKDTFAPQAEKLCMLGATDVELADFFEVDVRTIYRWKNSYPAFCHALKTGKDILDERVERSLYNRAVGYSFDSEKVFQFQGEVVRAKIKEHVPPDTTAAIFWLKNRRSLQWRDVRQHEVGQPGDFERMSDAELRAEIAKEAKDIGVDPAKKLNGQTQH